MDDQRNNALSINVCIKYKLVVCEPRHTIESGLSRRGDENLTLLFDSVTNYYVRDRNVRNAQQMQYVIKMSAHFSATVLTTKKSFLYVR